MRFEVPSQKPHFPDEITTHHRGIAELKHIQPHPAADETQLDLPHFMLAWANGTWKWRFGLTSWDFGVGNFDMYIILYVYMIYLFILCDNTPMSTKGKSYWHEILVYIYISQKNAYHWTNYIINMFCFPCFFGPNATSVAPMMMEIMRTR